MLYFALWPYVNGRPHPESNDPWGEDHAADCLTGYHDEDLGSYLTVVYAQDRPDGRGPVEDGRCIYRGDVAHHLRAYAARVAEDAGHPAFEGPAIEQARQAFEIAVEHTADERRREACYQWCEPNPDTSRSISRMPYGIRQNIASGARAEAEGIEAAHLDSFLCEALGIDATTGEIHTAAAAA